MEGICAEGFFQEHTLCTNRARQVSQTYRLPTIRLVGIYAGVLRGSLRGNKHIDEGGGIILAKFGTRNIYRDV